MICRGELTFRASGAAVCAMNLDDRTVRGDRCCTVVRSWRRGRGQTWLFACSDGFARDLLDHARNLVESPAWCVEPSERRAVRQLVRHLEQAVPR